MSTYALFVHSTGTGPSMWQPLAASLPAGVQAVMPFNIGYTPQAPLTVTPDAPFRLEHEVAHLLGQIPVDARDLHLVAHSYGAAVALMLAQALQARGPSPRVASLWLYEPVPFAALRKLSPDQLPADVQAQLAQLYADDSPLLDASQAGQDRWLQYFIDYWNGPGTWAAVPDRVRQGARLMGAKMFHEVHALSLRAPAFEQLRVDAPVTFVHGEQTRPPARMMAERLHQQQSRSHLDVMPGLGHMGLMGAPEAVRRSLAAHLDRVLPP